MTNIIINGVNGHMGHVLVGLADKDPELTVVAGVDPYGTNDYSFPVFENLRACNVDCDVVVDFSSPKAVDSILQECEDRSLPIVLCTTGLSDEQLSHVKKASRKVAVLRSANMSLGINTLINVLKSFSSIFTDAGFDVEIVEAHHNQKVDAPSGTALALADAVKEGAGVDYEYVYERQSKRQKRDAKELGISSIRGGNVAGTHEVMFLGEDEQIVFRHEATSKTVFAKGALEAAKFLKSQAPGMYDMQDVIKARV